MLKACKKNPIIFEKAVQSNWDDKIFYLRLQPAASITCLGLPKFHASVPIFLAGIAGFLLLIHDNSLKKFNENASVHMVGGIGNGNLDVSGWNIFFENGSTGIPPSLNPEERVENPLFVDSNKDLSLAAGESPVERLISASTLPTQVPVEITAPGSLFDSLPNELIINASCV
mgnify:CR=1 FL=1